MKISTEMSFSLKKYFGSSTVFTLQMLFSALAALFWLFFILFIVTRLDVAFFEANGMVQNADVREAFFYQVFQFEPVIIGMLFAGIVAIVVLSFLFCKSQFDYFKHLNSSLTLMAERGETPPTTLLGRFNPHATYFFEIVSRRINGETEESLDPFVSRVLREWPRGPRISWFDLLQFTLVSGMMGLFFAACCMVVYLKVAGRVVELAQTVVHFTTPSGPSFLSAQFGIVDYVIWILLILMVIAFCRVGYRLGGQIAEADYAILRDLRDFMEGNFRKRLFLRSNDPAHEYVHSMNSALERIAERLRNPGSSTQEPPEEGSAQQGS